jgi:hypothetical protein
LGAVRAVDDYGRLAQGDQDFPFEEGEAGRLAGLEQVLDGRPRGAGQRGDVVGRDPSRGERGVVRPDVVDDQVRCDGEGAQDGADGEVGVVDRRDGGAVCEDGGAGVGVGCEGGPDRGGRAGQDAPGPARPGVSGEVGDVGPPGVPRPVGVVGGFGDDAGGGRAVPRLDGDAEAGRVRLGGGGERPRQPGAVGVPELHLPFGGFVVAPGEGGFEGGGDVPDGVVGAGVQRRRGGEVVAGEDDEAVVPDPVRQQAARPAAGARGDDVDAVGVVVPVFPILWTSPQSSKTAKSRRSRRCSQASRIVCTSTAVSTSGRTRDAFSLIARLRCGPLLVTWCRNGL